MPASRELSHIIPSPGDLGPPYWMIIMTAGLSTFPCMIDFSNVWYALNITHLAAARMENRESSYSTKVTVYLVELPSR